MCRTQRQRSVLHLRFGLDGPAAAIPTISVEFPLLRFHFRHADEAMDWDHTIICAGGETLESIDTTFDDPATREYWGCGPICEVCGVDVFCCDCNVDSDPRKTCCPFCRSPDKELQIRQGENGPVAWSCSQCGWSRARLTPMIWSTLRPRRWTLDPRGNFVKPNRRQKAISSIK